MNINVRCLNEHDKNAIVEVYLSHQPTLVALADAWDVSPRTIGRVLDERGIATPMPRVHAEARKVLKVLQQHNITVYELEDVLNVYRGKNQPIHARQQAALFRPHPQAIHA